MNLEQQVVSLDLAKRLKKLGVKQESVLYWVLPPTNERYVLQDCPDNWLAQGGTIESYWNDSATSAFTVAELGEILPYEMTNETEDSYLLTTIKFDDFYGCCYQNDLGQITGEQHEEATEADARAEMLIYLIENKLISV